MMNVELLFRKVIINNCTADVDLLLLSLNKRNRNLQYNCHKAKIIYNNDKKSNQIIQKIPRFRVLIIIYRAFLLETDVPDIGLDGFYLSFERKRVFKLFDRVR